MDKFKLASLAMTGAKTSEHDFSNEHGSTSSGDHFDSMADSRQRTSSSATIWNDDNIGPR